MAAPTIQQAWLTGATGTSTHIVAGNTSVPTPMARGALFRVTFIARKILIAMPTLLALRMSSR